MPILRKNYYPPADSVIDQNESRARWDGKRWVLNGKTYTVPSSHRLVGRPGGSHAGWYYDWKQRAWMQPDSRPSAPTTPGRAMPTPGRPLPMPVRPSPVMPAAPPAFAAPSCTPCAQQEIPLETKEANVLEYLMKHPVAPVVGGFLLLSTQLTEEPLPPTIPPELPDAVAKQWQMIYAQNLQRFQRRMTLWENVGKLLLGYADTNAVLAALPPKVVR